MNDRTDNELIDLYRAGRASVGGLDAETLLAWVEGSLPAERLDQVAAQLAASPSASALVAMLAELDSDSIALAQAAGERRIGRHDLGRRDQRRVAAAPQRRVARWTRSIAAAAVVAVALFAFHGTRQPAEPQGAVQSDRIFSMQDDRIFDWTTANRAAAAGTDGDRVFHSSFAKGG